MALLRIKNLFLRSFIGFSEHEVGKLQDVIINITLQYNSSKAELTDNPDDTLNYKLLTKEIVKLVENGHFNLIEAMARKILNYLLKDERVIDASVEIDKPHALRFAESVSVSLSANKDEK